VPEEDDKIYFTYTLESDVLDELVSGGGTGMITDMSNIPYGIKRYRFINEIGKNWIRRYTLALTKEMLGYVRGKYASIPMTLDNEVTLNGADLISAAQTEKEGLITELTEVLDSMSRQAQLERKTAEKDALSSQLTAIPLKIYVK
jgi:hypothetical protein